MQYIFSRSPRFFIGVLTGASLSALIPITSLSDASSPPTFRRQSPSVPQRPDLREISRSEVSRHKNPSSSVWVTFDNGVYDITDFISVHPGGTEPILEAAGGSLEPFWDIYTMHNEPFVREVLEEYRIGNLPKSEMHVPNTTVIVDAFANDPPRDARLRVRSQRPFNAETSAEDLAKSQLTPTELFYVRNHLPVPKIEEKDYRLEIVGMDGKVSMTLTLDELKKFEKNRVAATVQCAGNRRNEMNNVRTVKGGAWDIGAIGNAEWAGARLRDVLDTAGVLNHGDAKHICFEGLDKDPAAGTSYGASIPMDVIETVSDVLLAYEMNGEPLSPDHGYPVRVIVPGVVGARNVKWLGRVSVSKEESESHWQRRDYKGFAPDVDWDSVDFDKAPAIQELPVVSAICAKEVDQKAGIVRMRGYAWSGGGRGIVRVDVSANGGKTWTAAQLKVKKGERRNRVYDWTLWEAAVPVNLEQKDEIELVCKAVDSAYNTQPDTVDPIWNLRGVLNNAWHRVRLVA